MLLWKMILDRWHLTHDDLPICQMSKILTEQLDESVCSVCLDYFADAEMQWQSLNLSALRMKPDSLS